MPVAGPGTHRGHSFRMNGQVMAIKHWAAGVAVAAFAAVGAYVYLDTGRSAAPESTFVLLNGTSQSTADLRGALLGKRPCPADEIWLRDSDIVLVPKSPILVMDDFINLVFTRGLYGIIPVGVGVNFAKASSI